MGERHDRVYHHNPELGTQVETSTDIVKNVDLGAKELFTRALLNGEGVLTEEGVLITESVRTGRSPNERRIVRDNVTSEAVNWSDVNREMKSQQFDKLKTDMLEHMENKETYEGNYFVGAHDSNPVKVVTETASHQLFANNIFRENQGPESMQGVPNFSVIHSPSFKPDPELHGADSDMMIAIDFEKGEVLIAGSLYDGEIKKSIFTMINYYANAEALPLHCSVSVGENGEATFYIGLSGTGKTTLSMDELRNLVGDDEHIWGKDRVQNIEGGVYMKTKDLTEEGEPILFDALHSKNNVLGENIGTKIDENENTVMDLGDGTIVANARASVSISQIRNYVESGTAEHPVNIVLLTADAYGAMPLVSKLTPEQAEYYFLLGPTSKVSGTEFEEVDGDEDEDEVDKNEYVSSACFGDPFLPKHPTFYSELFGKKIKKSIM